MTAMEMLQVSNPTGKKNYAGAFWRQFAGVTRHLVVPIGFNFNLTILCCLHCMCFWRYS